ncbi:hypothetical protein JTE90_012803 [Oedothorax gibbosus]|uniref:Uncharacterized protein n=1 Tax=Oedothorax gibbosus TaxID=931172 RepID=A0AAV6W0N8_9ARAC|nr:hypothetical protein JTE90_012803 [Oedothorax gibbosus]
MEKRAFSTLEEEGEPGYELFSHLAKWKKRIFESNPFKESSPYLLSDDPAPLMTQKYRLFLMQRRDG